MHCRDPYGYALTTGVEAADAYTHGVRDLLRLRAGAAESVARRSCTTRGSRSATPPWRCSATSCAPRSTSAPGCGTPSGTPPGAPSASGATCTPSSTHVRGDSRPLIDHLRTYPRDALLLSTAVPTIAFAGVTEVPEEAWAIVEHAIPAYGDDWWFTGLLAFVRQEQRRFDEAMELSCRSLAEEPPPGTPPTRGRTPTTRPATTRPGWPGWTAG